MGYYDEDVTERASKKQNSKWGFGLSAFLGAIVGGLVVILSIPVLSNSGLLPYTINERIASEVVPELPSNDVQTVNLNVHSEVTDAVNQVSDAVVGVINMKQTGLFSQELGEGTGSGVVYKKAGDRAFVVTNHHVIENANQIEVSLTDGKRIPAKLVGSDLFTDLAVLEIEANEIGTVAEFGNSDTVNVGEPAIAIGNPLGLTFSSTVTQGIISAKERSIPVDLTGNGQIDWHAEVLQTDAAINPGNSGGALLNIEGQVIGINSMKIAQSAVEGIGFAIPTSIAVPVIEDLELHGEVRRPQLGVGFSSLNEIPSFHWQETLKLPKDIKGGVVVASVAPGSPADRAQLQQYDVIVKIGGEDVQDGHDLRKYLYTELEIGDEVELSFYRDGKLETVTVQLTEEQNF